MTQWTVACQAPLSMGILQASILECLSCPPPGESSQPRDQTQVSRIAADSLPTESPGKTKSSGLGSLSLLWGIFPTKQLNQGLLNCKQILYQLTYQESPICFIHTINSVYVLLTFYVSIRSLGFLHAFFQLLLPIFLLLFFILSILIIYTCLELEL